MSTTWDADRVLNELASIYRDLRSKGVEISREAGYERNLLLQALTSTLQGPENSVLLKYARVKALTGAPPSDDKMARALAERVAERLAEHPVH